MPPQNRSYNLIFSRLQSDADPTMCRCSNVLIGVKNVAQTYAGWDFEFDVLVDGTEGTVGAGWLWTQ